MGQQQSTPVCQLCGHFTNSALTELAPDEINEVSKHKACAFFKKGQIMMQEGMRPTGVYCVNKGKAKLYKLGSNGREQIIRFIKPGDLIGYRSMLSGETISASIEALEDTHACFIPKNLLFQLIERNPKFSLNLMKLACHELGEAGKLITNLAQKSVRERLAEVLLIIKSNFGETEDGYLDISLTREEISNMVGTATESVIRLLSDFNKEGLIEIKGRKLKLLNPSALARVGNVYD